MTLKKLNVHRNTEQNEENNFAFMMFTPEITGDSRDAVTTKNCHIFKGKIVRYLCETKWKNSTMFMDFPELKIAGRWELSREKSDICAALLSFVHA